MPYGSVETNRGIIDPSYGANTRRVPCTAGASTDSLAPGRMVGGDAEISCGWLSRSTVLDSAAVAATDAFPLYAPGAEFVGSLAVEASEAFQLKLWAWCSSATASAMALCCWERLFRNSSTTYTAIIHAIATPMAMEAIAPALMALLLPIWGPRVLDIPAVLDGLDALDGLPDIGLLSGGRPTSWCSRA